jgi:hypothetical protein
MQAVAPVHLVSLLIAATAILAACLTVRSVDARRKKRLSRVSFVLGFACGLVAGPVVKSRRGRRVLMVVTRRIGIERFGGGRVPLRCVQARRVRSR